MLDQSFGKYALQEELAWGSMGVVYKAVDRSLNRLVAIKILHKEICSDPSFTERFLREARAMARLVHENVITIHAIDGNQGSLYVVMEYFPGTNLRKRMKDGEPLSVSLSVNIALQVASALAYAHNHGIVHREIKPSNILIDKRGRTKLINFGLAAALDECALDEDPTVNVLPGKYSIEAPLYIPPEQAKGMKMDGRTDLYSLGIVLHEMLTGHTPFQNLSRIEILGRLCGLGPDHKVPLDFPDAVPAPIRATIEKLVQYDPEHRTATAQSLVDELQEQLRNLPAQSDSPREDPARKRHPFNPASNTAPNSNVEGAEHRLEPVSFPRNISTPHPVAPKIFICYRRGDSADITGRIYDWLLRQFGEAALFKDVDSIPYGMDFRAEIDNAISTCTAVLAIVGPRWLAKSGRQKQRDIDNPSDYVRIELASALRRQIPIIPVLVAGESMPSPDTLPDDLREFSYRNAIQVKPDPDFRADMDRLIKGISKLHEGTR
jgi:serine/threonine protein kinase